jgi:hypothetical protein
MLAQRLVDLPDDVSGGVHDALGVAVDRAGPSERRWAGVAQPLPPYRTLDTVRWEAETVSRLLGTAPRAAVRLRRLGPRRRGGHGVAIVPAGRLREALGQDRVLSDANVELLAAAARLRLRPAA